MKESTEYIRLVVIKNGVRSRDLLFVRKFGQEGWEGTVHFSIGVSLWEWRQVMLLGCYYISDKKAYFTEALTISYGFLYYLFLLTLLFYMRHRYLETILLWQRCTVVARFHANPRVDTGTCNCIITFSPENNYQQTKPNITIEIGN